MHLVIAVAHHQNVTPTVAGDIAGQPVVKVDVIAKTQRLRAVCKAKLRVGKLA